MYRNLYVLGLFALFSYVLSPMLIPVAMGIVFAILFFPAHDLFQKKLKLGPYLSSGLITVGVVVLVILPTSYMLLVIAETGVAQIGAIQAKTGGAAAIDPTQLKNNVSFLEEILTAPAVKKIVDQISQFYPIDLSGLVESARDLAAQLGIFVANTLTQFLASLPNAFLNVVVMVASLFFLLIDGKRLVGFIKKNSFFNQAQTNEMLRYSGLMCRSVMLALVASGLFQSLTFSLAAALCGVSSVVLIFGAVFFTSFLPLVGSSPVTIGISIYQLIVGETTVGLALLVASGVVGFGDNLIRPMVIKGAGDLHPLITFISAFGGIQIFGVTGVFLGPIIAGIFVVTLQTLTKNSKPSRAAS